MKLGMNEVLMVSYRYCIFFFARSTQGWIHGGQSSPQVSTLGPLGPLVYRFLKQTMKSTEFPY